MIAFCLFLLFVLLFVFLFLDVVGFFWSCVCPFLATMSFAGYLLVRYLLSAFSVSLRTCSRFDLVWFRLSCDHGWIRSGLVNVR